MLGGPLTEGFAALGGLIGAGAAIGSVFGVIYVALRTGPRAEASAYLEGAAAGAIVMSFVLPIFAAVEEVFLS